MNAIQLECFLAVADNLNFARAAEKLHITQPAVTHQINSLETELDAKLFHRTTRSVELTPAGWNFFGDARNILNLMTAAKKRIARDFNEQTVRFTVGCPSVLEMQLLPHVIGCLNKEFPNMHPVLKSAPLPALQNFLEDSSVDVLICFKENGRKGKTGTYTELLKAAAACVVSPSHPLALKSVVTTEDLKEGNAILCDPRQNPQAVVSIQHQLAGCRPPSDVYMCDHYESAVTLIKAGLGFSILPDIPPGRDPGLHYIPLKGCPPASFGIYSSNISRNLIAKRFTAIAKELFEPTA